MPFILPTNNMGRFPLKGYLLIAYILRFGKIEFIKKP